jgi:hypothetical protein
MSGIVIINKNSNTLNEISEYLRNFIPDQLIFTTDSYSKVFNIISSKNPKAVLIDLNFIFIKKKILQKELKLEEGLKSISIILLNNALEEF